MSERMDVTNQRLYNAANRATADAFCKVCGQPVAWFDVIENLGGGWRHTDQIWDWDHAAKPDRGAK